MDEQAAFETRAVLAPRGSNRNRLAVVVPVLALAVVAWAGLSGPRSDPGLGTSRAGSAETSSGGPAAATAPTAQTAIEYPTRVVGLDVHRLADILPWTFGRDQEVALSGWYVATDITGCPPLDAIYRASSPPNISDGADSWAFCERSGVLYGSPFDLGGRVASNNPGDDTSNAGGLPAVPVALAVGVIVPTKLEVIGTGTIPVVVVGRFVESPACEHPVLCRRELVVDHVAWVGGV